MENGRISKEKSLVFLLFISYKMFIQEYQNPYSHKSLLKDDKGTNEVGVTHLDLLPALQLAEPERCFDKSGTELDEMIKDDQSQSKTKSK